MHYRETTKISREDCAKSVGSLGPFILDGNLCTRNPTKKGVCTADSGGPLTTSDNYLKGILSWNSNCMAGKPDVYTDVVTHAKWIKDEIAKE